MFYLFSKIGAKREKSRFAPLPPAIPPAVFKGAQLSKEIQQGGTDREEPYKAPDKVPQVQPGNVRGGLGEAVAQFHS
jgi:hypothetical protein